MDISTLTAENLNQDCFKIHIVGLVKKYDSLITNEATSSDDLKWINEELEQLHTWLKDIETNVLEQDISQVTQLQTDLNTLLEDVNTKLANDEFDGQDGNDGDSAYQIAVNNGFVGTEVEWIESIKATDYNLLQNKPIIPLNVSELDDYEEGIQNTTAITCSDSGTINLAGSQNTLSYTKIGRKVTVIGRLSVTSVDNPTGYLKVSLPFVIANLSEVSGTSSGSVVVVNADGLKMQDFCIYGNQTTSELIIGSANTTSPLIGNIASSMKIGTLICINFTYFTN